MGDIKTSIGNGLAVAGGARSLSRNADGVYSGKQTPYFAMPQNRIASLYGQYADDCYEAEMQGYDPENFYQWFPVKIRCEDVSREATGTNLSDDVKGMVVYYPEGVNYVPLGAMVKFASNTWLVTNSANISSILSESIIRRCNLVYNRLDWYGNVLSCPFNNAKMAFRGAQDDYTKNMILADHYFTCSMQLNEVSSAIHENTRMILGDAAYSVRGLNNFSRDFTDDPDSVRIIYFQLQREEKTDVYDDMERKIADGLAFSWDINITAGVSMRTGQSQTLAAASIRCGQTVRNSDEKPIDYLWESSDKNVLTVDAGGVVTAVGEGTATIRCKLAQNPSITENVQITVTQSAGAYVAFSGALPSSVTEQQSAEIEAAYYVNGEKTEEDVAFTLSGPEPWCYSADADGNKLTIACWERSDEPLTVTASCGGETATINIILEAW